MADWDIEVGQTLPRSELHDRWGGGRYGGMEPSVKAESVFLFSNPSAGEAFGYKYDGWHSDGTFHYTGDGQVGDQTLRTGGNKSIMDADGLGRTIRMFRSAGRDTTYLGEFMLADPPYYRADALDREGELRSVLVFRLTPLGQVVKTSVDAAGPDTLVPEELPVEAHNVDKYAAQRPDEPREAVRREARLVGRYTEWLSKQGQEAVRHRVPIPGGGYLFTDVYNKTAEELVEAKASGARSYVRAGLGQLLDYARFVDHRTKALLVPVRPSEDLVDLMRAHGCSVIWEEDGRTFQRHDPR
ncbi:hypothetical protein [Ornithinimicrobium pekingense]|uniref:ScoMcrA-like SRA domain-containing protein n=1 Tax=Ornithinimicrobium pekingense TaxID=384677 RepID=A0ABQ2F902_9MICO|nr:hypothetical protein [Ornithinimicrobium pekingense]GGK64154.1 hypothetical protein GCM10011509_10730 [Ornithinimicrobium pekingense]